jgi:hypothetical protein
MAWPLANRNAYQDIFPEQVQKKLIGGQVLVSIVGRGIMQKKPAKARL